MKHYITSSQAAVILEVLEKLMIASEKSTIMMDAINIDKHDLKKCKELIEQIK